MLILSLSLVARLWGWTFDDRNGSALSHPLEAEDGDMLLLQGRVVKAPERRSLATVRLTVAVDAARSAHKEQWQPVSQQRVLVDVYTRGRRGLKGNISHDLQALTVPEAYGYRIEAHAQHRPNASGCGRPLRMRAYWKNVRVLQTTRGQPLMEGILAVKSRLLQVYRRDLPDPVYRLAAGAILGDRGPVRTGTYGGQRITTLFAHAGIGHVLAVSGLHVGILAGGLIMALRGLRVPRRLRIIPLALALVAYLVLTGARPATARATLMAVAATAVYAFGKPVAAHAVWGGLVASAMILLAWRPSLLFDPGFQLSYGAVLSLLLLTRPIGRRLDRLQGTALLFGLAYLALATILIAVYPRAMWDVYTVPAALMGWKLMLWAGELVQRRFPLSPGLCFSRLPRPVRSLIAAQFAIQLGVIIPIGSLHFGRFATAGTVVNLFAIPLIAVFVQAGILAGLLSLIPWIGPLLAWLPGTVTTVSGLLFLGIADLGAGIFPCPSVPRPSAALLCTWYAALALVFFGRGLRAFVVIRAFPFLHSPSGARQAQEART